LELAGRQSAACQEALLERLLCAYFEDGEDLGRADVLLRHGAAVGLETAAMEDVLLGADWPFAHADRGGFGVPYFVFNGRYALSGAQPASALLMAMSRAFIPAQQTA